MKFSLKGKVTIRVGKTSATLKNDVSPDFALTLARTILVGTSAQGGYAYASGFSLPTGILILLLNNNSVVATIQSNVTKFKDQFTTAGEQTSMQVVGSDATPTQFTFNRLELYTVVGQTLYLQIAYVNLPSPVTKNQNDIVQITWVEEIISGGTLIAFNSQSTACANCTATCNTLTLQKYPTLSAVPNLLWALMLVPGLNKLASQTSIPMAPYINSFYNYYASNNATPPILGVTSIVLTDNCLNIIATENVTAPIITISLSNCEAIVSLALYITPQQNVYYALPVFVIQQVTLSWLGIVPVSNQSGISAGELSIVIKVPYGNPTLQALNVNE